MTEKKKRRVGFAAMDGERLREIARAGGRAAHRGGVTSDGKRERKPAHEWTASEAREAGRLGGLAAAAAKKEREQKESA